MNIRNKFYLLVCVALCVLFAQALWAQTPVTIKLYGTDGGPVTDSLTLAIHPNGNNDSPCVADSINPNLKESSQGLPPPPQGVDMRVVPYAGFDCLSNYTSIHKLTYDTQTDVWKIQFQRDGGQSGFDFSWQSGLAGVGAGYWKLVGDPNDAEPSVVALNVDMTSTTMAHVDLSDTDPHVVFLRKGDGAKMRSFTPNDIATGMDSKGKVGKSEKRKAYGSTWCLQFTNATGGDVNDIHIEFSQNVLTVLSSDGWTPAGTGTKKLDFTAPGGDTLHNNGVWNLCGIGDKGKDIAVSKWYWTLNGTQVGTKNKGATEISGYLRYKVPNINNIGEECYAQNVWTETVGGKPGGIVIGVQTQVGSTIKGAPIYRFAYHPKWKDVLKTLVDKTGQQTGPAACLSLVGGKPLVKGQKSLPPGKENNALLGEAVALAFNIGASDANKMHDGFGDMVYVKQLGDPAGLANGSTVRSIDAHMDSVMSCADTTSGTAAEWLAVLTRINGAFSGPFDSSSFITPQGVKTAGGTQATGVKAVADVDFLYRTSLVASPVTIAPLDLKTLEKPISYQLDQNYPNPFNPTTTIQFTLAQDAFVTLKVYNMLGQEVKTLAENEEMTQGENDVTFDASSLASGVYFYRIIAQGIDDNGVALKGNTFTAVKKMMLVK